MRWLWWWTAKRRTRREINGAGSVRSGQESMYAKMQTKWCEAGSEVS